MVDLDLPDELYLRFRDLLHSRCGLDYGERKRADLAHRLSCALQASGLPDLAALYTAAASGTAWDLLLAHVTIGETYFFRNGPQFQALREQILPEILSRRTLIRTVRLWSAGCATGEEPYSLAILLAELLGDTAQWQLSILGSDINPAFLARAREGVYGAWSFRETPERVQATYFTPEGSRWRLAPTIRRMVHFGAINLAAPEYPAIANGTCALDLILCRNVTIYFDPATTRQVVERLYQALTPGGWLVVGHAEPQVGVYAQFEVHNFPDTVVYRKPLYSPLFGPPRTPPEHALSPRSAPPRTPTPLAPPAPELPPVVGNAALQPDDAPDDPGITELVQLARRHADRGDWANAELCCLRALASTPLARDVHYLLGQIHEHQGRLDAALSAYRRAVYLDRGFVPGLVGMGQVWQALGRPADALRCYRNAHQQLARLPGTTPLPHADGAVYADLAPLVTQQLRLLESVVGSQ